MCATTDWIRIRHSGPLCTCIVIWSYFKLPNFLLGPSLFGILRALVTNPNSLKYLFNSASSIPSSRPPTKTVLVWWLNSIRGRDDSTRIRLPWEQFNESTKLSRDKCYRQAWANSVKISTYRGWQRCLSVSTCVLFQVWIPKKKNYWWFCV